MEQVTQRVNKEAGMVDTKAVRQTIEGTYVRLFDGTHVTIREMCDEIDRLRGKVSRLDADRKQLWDTAQQLGMDASLEADRLRAEVARLREKCGEKVCSKCGKTSDTLHRVTLATHYEVVPPNVVVYLNVCRDCIINALAALRK